MAPALFRDFNLKVLAVGIAILLWMNVAEDRVIERGLAVHLDFENVPAGLTIAGLPPDMIRVRVRGSAGVVGRVTAGDVSVALDLSGRPPGLHTFEISDERIRTPAGVDVASVAPAAVAVTLARSGAEARD